MIKVLFVCLGNICQSPMAQFVFKQMVAEKGLADQFENAQALGCVQKPQPYRHPQRGGSTTAHPRT